MHTKGKLKWNAGCREERCRAQGYKAIRRENLRALFLFLPKITKWTEWLDSKFWGWSISSKFWMELEESQNHKQTYIIKCGEQSTRVDCSQRCGQWGTTLRYCRIWRWKSNKSKMRRQNSLSQRFHGRKILLH